MESVYCMFLSPPRLPTERLLHDLPDACAKKAKEVDTNQQLVGGTKEAKEVETNE